MPSDLFVQQVSRGWEWEGEGDIGTNLLNECLENGGDHEDGVDNTSHAGLPSIGLPKGKSNEQTSPRSNPSS